MFRIPQPKLKDFNKAFQNHRLSISACNIFFQNVIMLNGRHTILTRDDYVNYYKGFTWDIELETSPIDAFIPCDKDDVNEEGKHKLFVTNQTVPEYERIKKRVTMDELKQTLGETHDVIMALNNNKVTMDDVIDDIFIYYCLFKYLDQIAKIRIKIFSNMSEMIEFIVDEFTIDDFRQQFHTNRVNPEKVDKYNDLIFFEQDYKMICDFYKTHTLDFPTFDLDNLIDRLFTNIDIKSDLLIVLGTYLIASYAVSDIKRGIDSPCANYVRCVLSIL